MIKMDNGALLALGLVGVVAAAGRMKRGSFGIDLRAQIQHVLAASEQDEEVDSGDLVTLLEQVRDSDQFSWFSRDLARDLLRQSEEDESLDTGDALSVLGDALRRPPESRAEAQKKHAARKGGSRAVGVNANSAKSRAEYVAYLDDLAARAKAGELNFDEDSRWSFGADTTPHDPHAVNRKLITQAILKNIATERAWISTWTQRNPGAGSKAVYGMSPTDAGHVLRVGGAQPKIRSNAGEALNDYRWHPDRALAELEAARGKGKGGSRAKRKPVQGTVGGGMVFLPPSTPGGPPRFGLAARGGEHRGPPRLNPYTGQFKQGQIVKGGSRARKLHDDREYTHYVVHGPTMKILSGWSFPEDAWEEIKENLGTAGKDCKVYTRRHLTRSGLEPRENTNWGGAALHQSLFRT